VGELTGHVRTRVGNLELDVPFETEAGRLVVVGPNGAGKTSLLGVLLGVLPADEGWAAIGPSRFIDVAANVHVPTELRRIGYLPQSYALFPHLTARRNVEFGMFGKPAAQRRERALRWLDEVGALGLAERRCDGLSGGERQRVGLARALAAEPRALLLDEPTAAMDVSHRRQVREFLGQHLTRLRIPTLVVTHDVEDAEMLGQRVMVLEAGRVTQVGTLEELARAPGTRFVEQFTSKMHA
jgi:molybdate transport system ATP-binding protein